MKDITKMEFVVEHLSFLGDAKPRETETKTPASRRGEDRHCFTIIHDHQLAI